MYGMRTHTRQEVIQAAGGCAHVARRLGIRRQAVYQWIDTGIPARRVIELARMAGMRPSEIDPELYPPELEAG